MGSVYVKLRTAKSRLGDIPEEAEVNECAADCAAGSRTTTAGNSMLKDLLTGTVYHRSAAGKVVLTLWQKRPQFSGIIIICAILFGCAILPKLN